MKKRILSVILGLVIAVIVISIVESLGHFIYPVAAVNFNDKAALVQFMQNLPTGALVIVFIAWLLGSFIGGGVATIIAKENGLRSSIIIGSLILLFSIINMLTLPHPLWMWIFSIVLIIPTAVLGSKLVAAFWSKAKEEN